MYVTELADQQVNWTNEQLRSHKLPRTEEEIPSEQIKRDEKKDTNQGDLVLYYHQK